MPIHRATILAGMGLRYVAWLITRSGDVGLGGAALRALGGNNSLWSSVAQEKLNSAYHPGATNSDIYIAYYNMRWFGLTVRCLVN